VGADYSSVLVRAVDEILGTHRVDRARRERQRSVADREDACGRERRLVTRTWERYGEIRERLDAGQSLAAICRALDLDRNTAQRFARAASVDDLLVNATNRESKLA
jgi:hypothetical protein